MIPVTYSAKSQVVVDAFNAGNTKDPKFWLDKSIVDVKKEIKDHYLSQQKNRCAYCNHKIESNNHALWDAEHVIDKKGCPQFLFEPRNLAISCKDCNIAKGETEVRVRSYARFPARSKNYLIVHPHFDAYDDHIGWIGTICFAKTKSKGSKTIAICNLTRYAALSIGETSNIMNPVFNRLIAELMKASSESEGRVILAGIAEFFRKP